MTVLLAQSKLLDLYLDKTTTPDCQLRKLAKRFNFDTFMSLVRPRIFEIIGSLCPNVESIKAESTNKQFYEAIL
jgi:hypothetical protein